MRSPVKDERRHLTYALAELAKPDLSPGRRAVLEAKAAAIGKRLAARCTVCGRPLEDAESLARGVGPDCWSKVDPREYPTEAEVAASITKDRIYDIADRLLALSLPPERFEQDGAA